MAALQDHKPSTIACNLQSLRQATADWLNCNGQGALFALGTVFMWSAAAHAAYLADVPEPLRVSVARRNQRVWKGLAVGSLVGVALYDSVHSALVSEQQHQLTADAKHIRAQLHNFSREL